MAAPAITRKHAIVGPAIARCASPEIPPSGRRAVALCGVFWPTLSGPVRPGRRRSRVVAGSVRRCPGRLGLDDCDVLRAGRTRRLLGGWLAAPSTLGRFLRDHVGHVRHSRRAAAPRLERAWKAGAGPGDGVWALTSTACLGEVCGRLEQDAAYGYTQLLGYHPILATRAGAREALHIRHHGRRERCQAAARRQWVVDGPWAPWLGPCARRYQWPCSRWRMPDRRSIQSVLRMEAPGPRAVAPTSAGPPPRPRLLDSHERGTGNPRTPRAAARARRGPAVLAVASGPDTVAWSTRC
jgi:hypothetical protein